MPCNEHLHQTPLRRKRRNGKRKKRTVACKVLIVGGSVLSLVLPPMPRCAEHQHWRHALQSECCHRGTHQPRPPASHGELFSLLLYLWHPGVYTHTHTHTYIQPTQLLIPSNFTRMILSGARLHIFTQYRNSYHSEIFALFVHSSLTMFRTVTCTVFYFIFHPYFSFFLLFCEDLSYFVEYS